ncbi:hypothetical protein J5J10_19840 [Ciceribacter sp. L1K23]|uniref:hypothetical protein n=1 Tax=Ciceribacter sp. L1K23 TaxID=2820276 RepID=UPI001B83990E|nr:hypothetical protein [Ciceribacter sp. L1K23]MBR0557948.1 hypothetical protein [Ciceribacter sp. L1K23]
MFYEFIAAIVSAFAAGGIASGVLWMSKGRLPKWIVPACAGLAMLTYTVWSEYSWYGRMIAGSPPEVVIAWRNETTAPWRPWSYYKPVINRFTAVDKRTIQRNANLPDQVLVDVILASRWQRVARVKVLFDCKANRRADLLTSDIKVEENGAISGATWTDLPADDPVLRAACS